MAIKDTKVCTRLGEERKRLNLNQQNIASYCNVSVKTIGRWEKNIPIPADKLALLAKLGYDITYILTGLKLVPQTAGLDAAANIWNTKINGDLSQLESKDLNDEQAKWLNMLEALAGGDRERLELIGLALVGYSQAPTNNK